MALRMKDGIIYEVTIDSKGAVKSMKKVGVGLDKVDKKAKKASVGIAGMAKQFGGFAVATAAVYKLAGAFSRLVDTADKIDDLNKATGVSHELLSKIAVAAKKGNANLGSYDDAVGLVGKAMRKLAQSSADARDGLATTQRAFADLGISTADLLNGDGSLKKIDEIVRIVGDGIKNTSNKTDALAAASRLLGRAGAELVPMFSELGGEFSHLAVVIDKETAVAASTLNDEIDDLKKSFDTNLAHTSLMVTLGGFVAYLNDAVEEVGKIQTTLEGFRPPAWLTKVFELSMRLNPITAQAYIAADIIVAAHARGLKAQAEQAAPGTVSPRRGGGGAGGAGTSAGRGVQAAGGTASEMSSVFIAQEQAYRAHLQTQAQDFAVYDAYIKSLEVLHHSETMRREAEQAAKRQAYMDAWAADITNTMNQIGEVIAGTLASGIAEGLVEGTYDWQQALKAVFKQILAIIIKMLIVKAINAAMGGGMGGGAVNISLVKLHDGGPVGDLPRHHNGTLSRDEHPAVLQRGEYVLRRDAVSAIGASNVAEMNRTGQVAGGSTSITLHYNGSGSRQDAEKMADMTWDAFNRRIRRGEQLG